MRLGSYACTLKKGYLPKKTVGGHPAAADPKQTPQEPAPQIQRKLIRSGEMEFEIEAFDSTVANMTKIAAEEGGFVATVNSEKLPNGKVRGTVVIRCPPERLDTLILKLRGLGDLKSQKIGSQDVTKQYTDLESQLRAGRTMEDRLIQIIKTGKGEIKDLLLAEKELGVWRTKIETLEGEIRYYNNLISLSTLTLTLYEKEIRSPFGITETERVDLGIEAEDVEKAHQDALAAVADAKGRITKSELKQHAAGQFNAIVHAEVAPEAAGPLRDRLKQLGIVARLDVDRTQQTEGGSGKVPEIRVKKNDTQFFVSLYNLANVQPRQTDHVNLACPDAEAVYKAILERVEKAGGRVVKSNLNRQKNEQTTGVIEFEVKAAEAETVLSDVRRLGEVMRYQAVENPDAQNVTKSKRGFNCQLFALGMVAPRETSVIALAVKDVAASYGAILEAVKKAEGRILSAQLNEHDRHNVTAKLDFDVRREHEKGIQEAMAAAGDVYSRTSQRAQETENVVDSKTRLVIQLINLASIPPRETFTLAVEVANVDKAVSAVGALVAESKGRTVSSHTAHQRSGRIVASVVVDVPLGVASGASERIKGLGTVRVVEASKNPSVPDSALAIARLDVTLSNADLIVPSDEGLGVQIKKGLGTSFSALAWSLNLIVIGLCVAGPWTLIAWGGWKLYRRLRPKPIPAA
jgi:glycine cleavage system regulatory protein